MAEKQGYRPLGPPPEKPPPPSLNKLHKPDVIPSNDLVSDVKDKKLKSPVEKTPPPIPTKPTFDHFSSRETTSVKNSAERKPKPRTSLERNSVKMVIKDSDKGEEKLVSNKMPPKRPSRLSSQNNSLTNEHIGKHRENEAFAENCTLRPEHIYEEIETLNHQQSTNGIQSKPTTNSNDDQNHSTVEDLMCSKAKSLERQPSGGKKENLQRSASDSCDSAPRSPRPGGPPPPVPPSIEDNAKIKPPEEDEDDEHSTWM